MAESNLDILLKNHLSGVLPVADKEKLARWLTTPDGRERFALYFDAQINDHAFEVEDPLEEVYDRLIKRLQQEMNKSQAFIGGERVIHRVHFLRRGWLRYAAAVLIIICGVGGYFLINNKKTERSLAGTGGALQSDIFPGGDKAVLTLADGSVILLDSAANGNLAQQGNAAIVKLANGQIAYNLKGLAKGDVMMNTMTTPRGGQYQLTLPDGSRVWLNAASSIQFPAAFVGVVRNVKITGEVYFEVAKNKQKPFIVDVDGKVNVQVFGTSFNVNSYKEEDAIKTTLVDGSVKVLSVARAASSDQQSKSNETSIILKPGQQARLSFGRQLETVNADIEQTLAWKNVIFNFNGLDVRAVMAQLARWYDINVRFEGPVSTDLFTGEMYRNEKLSFILDGLRKMGIECKMEGKTVIVF